MCKLDLNHALITFISIFYNFTNAVNCPLATNLSPIIQGNLDRHIALVNNNANNDIWNVVYIASKTAEWGVDLQENYFISRPRIKLVNTIESIRWVSYFNMEPFEDRAKIIECFYNVVLPVSSFASFMFKLPQQSNLVVLWIFKLRKIIPIPMAPKATL